MSRLDTLDRIARSGEAVFALDSRDRVIYWSRKCEEILSRRAEEVLGRSCFEVMCGRDVHGNLHCYRNCAVMFQGRHRADDPIQVFTLSVSGSDGTSRELQVGTIVLRDKDPSLTTIVHVVRELDAAKPSALERKLREPGDLDLPREPGRRNLRERAAELTDREREVLEHLALGRSTAKIAKLLGISPVTVRNHVQKVLEKLDVHTKMAAVAYAYRYGIVEADDAIAADQETDLGNRVPDLGS